MRIINGRTELIREFISSSTGLRSAARPAMLANRRGPARPGQKNKSPLSVGNRRQPMVRAKNLHGWHGSGFNFASLRYLSPSLLIRNDCRHTTTTSDRPLRVAFTWCSAALYHAIGRYSVHAVYSRRLPPADNASRHKSHCPIVVSLSPLLTSTLPNLPLH